VEDEPAGRGRFVEIAGQGEPVLELDGHERFEGHHSSITGRPRRVHGDVGVAQCLVGAMLTDAHRLSDTGADSELAGGNIDGLL
jgi:hypothetical protein